MKIIIQCQSLGFVLTLRKKKKTCAKLHIHRYCTFNSSAMSSENNFEVVKDNPKKGTLPAWNNPLTLFSLTNTAFFVFFIIYKQTNTKTHTLVNNKTFEKYRVYMTFNLKLYLLLVHIIKPVETDMRISHSFNIHCWSVSKHQHTVMRAS